MTKKEVAVFNQVKDCVSQKLVDAYQSGDQSAIAVASEVFTQVIGLWNQLNAISE